MDGAGEYHAQQSKPIPKNQRPNIFSDLWMPIHNAVGGMQGKNGGTLDWVEGSEGRGTGVGKVVE